MMPLFRISVELSAEPLLADVVCNSQHALIPKNFYLMTGRIQFVCF